MRRAAPNEKPSEAWATATMTAGALSLLPIVSPLAALVCCALAAVGLALTGRLPERHAGRKKITAGLLMAFLGMGLFMAEGALFWRWKLHQAYEGRLAITHVRLAQIAEALERYRQDKGSYPSIHGIMTLRETLEPGFIAQLPVTDGFDGAFSADCVPEGFSLRALPPPPPGSSEAPPPLVMDGGFQPAPSPPPASEPPAESGTPASDEARPSAAGAPSQGSPPPQGPADGKDPAQEGPPPQPDAGH